VDKQDQRQEYKAESDTGKKQSESRQAAAASRNEEHQKDREQRSDECGDSDERHSKQDNVKSQPNRNHGSEGTAARYAQCEWIRERVRKIA